MTTKYPVKILAALNEIMAEVGYVHKGGENKFHGYRYAGESDLLAVLRPAMVKHGLILIPSHQDVSQPDQYGNTMVKVAYTMAHKDGDVWPDPIIVYGSGNDRSKNGGVGDKGLYKALTGANKYLLFKLFQIETGDDPERDSEGDKIEHDDTRQRSRSKEPGRTKFIPIVFSAGRDVEACTDVDQLAALLQSKEFKDVAMQSIELFPSTWTGPEEYSGLRGIIEKAGKRLGCEDRTTSYLVALEHKAREKNATNK